MPRIQHLRLIQLPTERDKILLHYVVAASPPGSLHSTRLYYMWRKSSNFLLFYSSKPPAVVPKFEVVQALGRVQSHLSLPHTSNFSSFGTVAAIEIAIQPKKLPLAIRLLDRLHFCSWRPGSVPYSAWLKSHSSSWTSTLSELSAEFSP
jgi:hypothetical protein